MTFYSPFFARQKKKKGFSSFFLWGDPFQNRPQNPALEVAYSLLESVDLTSQKEAIFGRKTAWGRVRWTGQKKRKKGCAKKGGFKVIVISDVIFSLVRLFLKKSLERVFGGGLSRSLRNDNNISRQQDSHFQYFIVMMLPREKKKNTAFLDDFPLCLQCPPPSKKKTNSYVHHGVGLF